jgi:hypothetical protein
VKLAEYNNRGAYTHGMEMDDRYVYLCGTGEASNFTMKISELAARTAQFNSR